MEIITLDANERQKLEERLTEVQRNARCVWRAVKLMVFLTAFAVVGIGYSTVLIPYWPQTMQQFLMYWPVKAHCALACASLSCAFVFVGLGLIYRRELSGLGFEIRHLATEVTGAADARIIPLVQPTSMNEAA